MNKKTYILRYSDGGGEIGGYISTADALRQSIFLLLYTDGGAYEIYEPEYGIKRTDLYSARRFYAESMLKRRLYEAIVRYFGNTVDIVGFDIKTVDGNIEATVYIEGNSL